MGLDGMQDLNEQDMIAVLTGEKTLDEVLPAPQEEPAPVEPAPVEPAPVEPAPVESEPVVLTRDGKHTIPYSRLEEVQNEAAALKEQNRLLNEQLLAAQAKPAEVPPTVTAPEDGPSLEEEYPEVARAVEKIVAARMAPLQQQVAATLAPVQEAAAKTAEEAHHNAIRAVFSDFDKIRQDPTPLNDWISKQPPLARIGYEYARDQGTTDQVVQLFTEFAKTQAAPAAQPVADAAAIAAAKVAGVKAAPPVSLSDVPGASAAAQDGTAALLDMSPTALMQKFANAQGSQNIMELLDRVV